LNNNITSIETGTGCINLWQGNRSAQTLQINARRSMVQITGILKRLLFRGSLLHQRKVYS